MENVKFQIDLGFDVNSYNFEYGEAVEKFDEDIREFIREAIDYKIAELMHNWPFIASRKVK